MGDTSEFDLSGFLPYLLNQAAEHTSLRFQKYYKDHYGMRRTEWRVLFHLGRYGNMTAKDICMRAKIHKTKVSRAVHALEKKRFLSRAQTEHDKRLEELSLTKSGVLAYDDLYTQAKEFDAALTNELKKEDVKILRDCLQRIANL